MEDKPKDRHLDLPAEANRDKHVNFVAQEHGEKDPALEENKNRPEEKQKDRLEEKKPKK
jgi:hypothetical protein